MQNELVFIGLNVTFECQVGVNATDGEKPSYDPVDIDWHFTPVGSDSSYVVLKAGVIDAGLVNDDGVTNSVDKIKYHREVWLHMTVRNAGFEDAGTYSCSLADNPLQNASSQLFVIGKFGLTNE